MLHYKKNSDKLVLIQYSFPVLFLYFEPYHFSRYYL